MKIEELSIKNFKGIKSIDLEPKKINLITGRNNTGKTSMLDSIDLLFNPNHINYFGDNYFKLIRENDDFCNISGELTDSKTNLRLEKMNLDEIWEEFIVSYIENYIDYFENYFKTAVENKEENDFPFEWTKAEEILRENLEKQLTDFSPSDILKSPIMLIKDDKEYPFVKHEAGRLINRRDIIEEFENELKLDKSDRSKFLRNIDMFIDRIFFRLRSAYRGFINKRPEDSETVNFVKELNPKKLAKDEDEEKQAVKEDDIEDYIKEKGLVDNLKSFNLNQLVFKKNGKKYGVPYEFMGDGFKTIVGILWHLLEGDYEKEVCLLEEPENHMHPGYTKELVYFLIEMSQEYDTQFFITTHDRDFIESFFGENISTEERKYLNENFSVINMKKDYYQDYDYDEAEYQIDELLMDLRGI